MNLYRNLSRLSEDHWTRPLEYLWLCEEFWDSAFLIGYYRRISKQWKRKLQLSESQFGCTPISYFLLGIGIINLLRGIQIR